MSSSRFSATTTRDQREQRAAAKAAELADGQTPETIGAFIDRAVRFLGEREIYQLHGVARHLGQFASTSEIVRNFVRTSLAAPAMHTHVDFAAVTAASWVATLRNSDGSHGSIRPGCRSAENLR